MVSIKQKRTMTLPQLVDWAWKNIEQVEGKEFKSNVRDSFDNYSTVQFSVDGYGFKTQWVTHKDTFTVEVEEELTEYTVIPKLMTTFKKTYLENGFGYQRARIDEDYTIKLMLDKAGMHGESVKTLHIVNDDGTHTLIWRDGRLVE